MITIMMFMMVMPFETNLYWLGDLDVVGGALLELTTENG
jgi:hypothetical protein